MKSRRNQVERVKIYTIGTRQSKFNNQQNSREDEE